MDNPQARMTTMSPSLVVTGTDRKRQLIQQGYCLFDKVLDQPMLQRMTQACDCLLAANPPRPRQRYPGSMLSIFMDPALIELIQWPMALEALSALGYPRPRFLSGYVISKPPRGPALYWHQDWWGWHDPVSYTELPQQLFLMYYLVQTTRENGCLRIIPGSHRHRHTLHDAGVEAHSDKARYSNGDGPIHQAYEDEQDVPVMAGDLVVGDARLLHAAHANKSDQRRTCITLWYLPTFDQLPESLQVAIAEQYLENKPAEGDAQAWTAIDALVPRCDSKASATPSDRDPDTRLV